MGMGFEAQAAHPPPSNPNLSAPPLGLQNKNLHYTKR